MIESWLGKDRDREKEKEVDKHTHTQSEIENRGRTDKLAAIFGETKKVKLEREIEDNKLEISQLEDRINVVQVDIGNCIVEKREENDKIKKLEETIVELKDEKGILESRYKEISKDLEQLKLRVPDSTDIDSEH